jgi:hypothetical protein
LRKAYWVAAAALAAFIAGCEIIAGLQDRQLETLDSSIDAAADVAPACTSPHLMCGTACIDPTSDPNHCGSCTKVCPASDASVLDASSGNPDPGIPAYDAGDASYVTAPSPTCATSSCGVACSPTTTLCNGLCYDTNDVHDHCGSCATACVAAEWCHGGHCCAPGTEYCGTACIDVVSDVDNCGACNVKCDGGACVGGACGAGVVYTDSFTTGVASPTQCTDWTNFRAKLTGVYTSITVRGTFDPVGHTCTGAAATTLCNALRNGTAVGATTCGGHLWSVDTICGLELNAQSGNTGCPCETPGYEVRPCIGNANWGGVNTNTCTPPSQTMTVICQ